jgi:hypothetical protein
MLQSNFFLPETQGWCVSTQGLDRNRREAYLNIVLLKEGNDPYVIFEGHLMGLWEGLKGWHIHLGLYRPNDILGKVDGVELGHESQHS